MALMDITDLSVLFNSVYNLLDKNGVFVFATQHPCFVTLTEKYMTSHSYYGVAIDASPRNNVIIIDLCKNYFRIVLMRVFLLLDFTKYVMVKIEKCQPLLLLKQKNIRIKPLIIVCDIEEDLNIYSF